jgi:hypothetical protein
MGPSAFADCSALTKVNIPGSLGIVSSYAFGECHSLKDVTIEEGITSFADSAFYGCSSLENIALPETVVNIGPHAFYGCKSLTNIDFPEDLTHLGLYAFGSCDSLKEVFIPATVTAIGPLAFSSCDNLTGIWVDEDNFRYSSDERGVLFDKEKTCIHKAPYKLSGVYVIPGTVETIVMDAMEGCADLTGLFLPDSIAYIDEFGVENCPNLSLVHYAGTLEQRNEIEIVSGNNSLLDAQWHYDVVVSEGMVQTAYYCSECDCTYLADGSVYYGITVGGIAVGSGNCADILGDGTANTTVREILSGYRWFYHPRNTPFRLNEDGYCEDIQQFRQLYLLALNLQYEGAIADDTGMTEEEIAAYMKDDANCILTFILTMEDGREMTYRFFRYSERHAMVSLTGDGLESITTFYTNAASVRRIATAAYDLMHGVYIDYEHRYED